MPCCRFTASNIDFTAWVRGTESAQIVAPFAQPLVVAARGGFPPTAAGGLEGEVVIFQSLGKTVRCRHFVGMSPALRCSVVTKRERLVVRRLMAIVHAVVSNNLPM